MIHLITCRGCGKQFESNRRNRAVCGRNCHILELAKQRKVEMADRACAHCGKSFKPNNRQQIYCSRYHKQLAAVVRLYWKDPEKYREKGRLKAQRQTKNGLKFKSAEVVRAKDMFYKYKITIEEYDEIVMKQGRACAICRYIPSGVSRDRLTVDHEHGTDRIRGLLCLKCNAGLGMLGDDLESLEKAVAYLAVHEARIKIA